MKQPLVSPLDRNATKEAQEMADFYEETLGFTPNSLFTMMHRPRIAKAFLEMNQAVMENKGRVTSSLKRLLAYLSSMTAGAGIVRHMPFGQQRDMVRTKTNSTISGSTKHIQHFQRQKEQFLILQLPLPVFQM